MIDPAVLFDIKKKEKPMWLKFILFTVVMHMNMPPV